MGKKRIVKKAEEGSEEAKTSQATASAKKKVAAGILFVQSTYNNTKLVLTDTKGNTLCWSSSGSLGFKGAKKGTPFAAAKVGELIGTKAQAIGMKDASVSVKGVGSGRESSIRGFISKGINITSIKDMTPVPHNGPKPPKPRRV
jgi:small subunit ribosomal protein S11